MAYIEFKDVSKIYKTEDIIVKALDGASFKIDEGELVVILGPSGAGKTTTLNILGGMDDASFGKVIVANRDITKYNKKKLIKYRRNDIGFVFQFYNLIQNLTALENVELASQISKSPIDPKEVLKLVGLEDRMNNFPSGLSGGEQQRVSIARAIMKNPQILLCDEPTGALDSKKAVDIEVKKVSEVTVIADYFVIAGGTSNTHVRALADEVEFKMREERILRAAAHIVDTGVISVGGNKIRGKKYFPGERHVSLSRSVISDRIRNLVGQLRVILFNVHRARHCVPKLLCVHFKPCKSYPVLRKKFKRFVARLFFENIVQKSRRIAYIGVASVFLRKRFRRSGDIQRVIIAIVSEMRTDIRQHFVFVKYHGTTHPEEYTFRLPRAQVR